VFPTGKVESEKEFGPPAAKAVAGIVKATAAPPATSASRPRCKHDETRSRATELSISTSFCGSNYRVTRHVEVPIFTVIEQIGGLSRRNTTCPI
jgi:hypothetical protein